MRFVSKHQTTKIVNGKTCTVLEYPFGGKNIDCALIKISGRYPETGAAINEASSEMAYVQSGRGKVVINGKGNKLKKGDAIIIEAKEKFYWQGKMTLIMSCSPAWNKEQYKIIKDQI